MDRIALALLGLLPFLWYAIPIFTDAAYYRSDLMDQFYPWWTYVHDRLLAGEFPLWNPYVLSGAPFHVNPQAALFYPINLPLFFLPFPIALPIQRALNSIVASWGMYLLIRHFRAGRVPSFLGALMFTYGSFMSYEIIYLPYINTMVWFPWQLLFLHKLVRKPGIADAVRLALVTAASFLGGMPQVFFVCHIALGLLFLFMLTSRVRTLENPARLAALAASVALAVLVTAGLSLVLLLPAARFIAFSPRTDPLLYHNDLFDYSLIAPAVKALFFPWLHWLYGAPYPQLEHVCFVEVPFAGSLAVVLVLMNALSRRRWWILAATVSVFCVAVLLARGVYSGFFIWAFEHLRPFQWFRWPYDYLHMCYPILAIAAALGFDSVLRKMEHRCGPTPCPAAVLRRRRIPAILFVAVVAVELWMFGSGYRRYIPERLYNFDYFKPAAAFVSTNCPYERVSVSSFDLMYFKNQQDVFFDYFLIAPEDQLPRENRHDSRDWLKRIKDRDIVPQMWARDVGQVYNYQEKSPWDAPYGFPSTAGAVFHYYDIGGYDPFMFGAVLDLYKNLPIERNWSLFNVKYVLTPNSISRTDLQPAFASDGVHVYENTAMFPRVMVPGTIRGGMDRRDVLERLAQADFDPTKEVLLEDALPNGKEERNRAAGTNGSACMVLYKPETVVVEATMDRAGVLVLHDIYHPDWRAYVDNKPVKMVRANYTFRACFLPEGKHTVVFRYQPVSFWVSAQISLVCWLICLGLLVRISIARRKRTSR